MKTNPLEITTFTGRVIQLDKMELEDVDVRDIAHHHSLTCRHNGACHVFYSTADHCLDLVKVMLHKQFSDMPALKNTSHSDYLWALLHHAPETYYGPPNPITCSSMLQAHDLIVHVNRVVFRRFGLIGPDEPYFGPPPNVMLIAQKILEKEIEQIIKPLRDRESNASISIREPIDAEVEFLDRFEQFHPA